MLPVKTFRNDERSFREPPVVELFFVDVGFGTSQVLVFDNEAIVVDCGGSSDAICSVLEQRRVKRLRALIISHLHDDHYEAAYDVLKYFKKIGSKVDKVLLDCNLLVKLLETAPTKALQLLYDQLCRFLREGDVVALEQFDRAKIVCEGRDWNLELLYLPENIEDAKSGGDSLNATSKVFAVNVGGRRRALLTADAPLRSFEAIYKRFGALAFDVSTVPHHGLSVQVKPLEKERRLYEEWARAERAFCSVGSDAPHDAPNADRLRLIAETGTRVFCSRATKVCVEDSIRADWLAFRDEFWRVNEPDFRRLNITPTNETCVGTLVAIFSKTRCEVVDEEKLQRFREEAARRLARTFPCKATPLNRVV